MASYCTTDLALLITRLLSASSGCRNKMTRAYWLRQRDLFSHSSWGWESEVKVLTGWISGENSFPGLQMAAFLLCPHRPFALCAQRGGRAISGVSLSSPKDTTPLMRALPYNRV